jgi:hypothetical protein
MWLHGPIGLDFCSLQPPAFGAFYKYLGLFYKFIFLDNFLLL